MCSHFIFCFSDPLPVKLVTDHHIQCCLGADLYQMHFHSNEYCIPSCVLVLNVFPNLLDWQYKKKSDARQDQWASLVPIPSLECFEDSEVRNTHVHTAIS